MAWTTPATFVSGAILTASQMNVNVRDNTNALYDSVKRYGYQTRTTTYSADQTTVGAAANVFTTSITFTADGTSTYWVETYVGQVDAGNNSSTIIAMVDNSGTDLGIIAYFTSPAASTTRFCFHGRVPYTPSAGSKTINLRAYRSGASNGALVMGAGGAGTNLPGWIAVYGPDLT